MVQKELGIPETVPKKLQVRGQELDGQMQWLPNVGLELESIKFKNATINKELNLCIFYHQKTKEEK